MSEYKVSIITPVYNTKDYIRDTFESVKNQTFSFEDMEIIFINDKSTDGSEEILKEFEAEYDNVFLYDSLEGKKGPGASRNYGISKSTADYIIFLDSDDIMKAEYVETVYNEITQNNVDLVKTGFDMNLGEITFPITQNHGRVEVSHDDVSILMDYNYFEPWCTIYRKSYLIEENIRFLERFNIYESFIFAVETIAKAKNGIILRDDFQGQIWTVREDGLHNKTLEKSDLEYVFHSISEMLLMLVKENQPPACVEKLTKFILSIWSYDLSLSKEPEEVINAFCFAKGFKINQKTMSEAFS